MNLLTLLLSLSVLLIPIHKQAANTGLILSVIMCIWLLRKYGSDYKQIFIFNGLNRAILFFGLVLAITIVFSTNKTESIIKYVSYTSYVLPYFIFIALKDIKNAYAVDIKKIYVAYVIGITIASIYAIAQYMLSSKLGVTSFYSNRAFFAALLELGIPFALSLFLLEKSISYKYTYLIILLVNLSALLLSQARGSWLGTAAAFSVILYVVLKNGTEKRNIIRFTALIIVFFVLATPFYGERVKTFFDRNWITNVQRIEIWSTTLVIAQKYPLMGVGIGNYAQVYKKTIKKISPDRHRFNHAHNSYLMMLAESGIVGLTAFLYLLWEMGKFIHRILAYMGNNPYVLGTWGLFWAMLISSLVDNFIWLSLLSKFMWLTIGAIAYAYDNDSKKVL